MKSTRMLPTIWAPILVALACLSQAQGQVIGIGARVVKTQDFHSFQTNPQNELAPTDMLQMPDGRFMVATLGGSVRLLDSSGGLISTLLGPQETGTTKIDVTHYGMTSVALHPQFDTPGTFGYGKMYALVTQQPYSQTGVLADFTVPNSSPGDPFTNQDVVREFDVSAMLDEGATSFVGESLVSRDIWRIDSPQASHNAFDIAFRSNGDMFISSGDGGFTELTGSFNHYNRKQGAQNLDVAYGKILRINPDPNAYTLKGGLNDQYSIPADNPFVGTAGAVAEIYANGLRSPYRMNLDPNDPNEETLWVGDVGAGSREEVSRVSKGSNLGWGNYEGTTGPSNINMRGNEHTPPEFQYSHSPPSLGSSGGKISVYRPEAGGNSITGGHIYRGTELGLDFQGMYVGANLGHHAGNAFRLPRLFYGDPDSDSVELESFQFAEDTILFDDSFLAEENLASSFDYEAAGIVPGKFPLPQLVLSIAEDNAGELYVLGVDYNGFGTISKLVPGAVLGDVDGNEIVDAADFQIIRDNLGIEPASRGEGDLTGDNRVGLDDFQQWLDQAPPSILATLNGDLQVPEPNAIFALVSAMTIGALVSHQRPRCL